MKKYILFSLLFIFITVTFSQVHRGVIDLRGYDFVSQDPVELIGDWEFIDVNGDEGFQEVPGSWGSEFGTALYSLNILSSGTENLLLETKQISSIYRVRLNGRSLLDNDSIRPLHIPINLISGENILEIEVENYTNVNGGIRNRIRVGDFNKVLKLYDLRVLHDAAYTGAALIMALFFLILFINNRSEVSSIIFALLCLFLALRTLTTNDKVLYDFLPNISYGLITRIEYFSMFILPILLLLFLYKYFDSVKYKKLYYLFFGVGSLFVLSGLVLPVNIYIGHLYYFFIYVLVGGIYILIMLVSFCFRKVADSGKILISVLVLVLAAIYDIFIILFSVSNKLVLSNAIIVFILMMSVIISQKELRMQKRVKRLSRENRRGNRYLSKFVPNSFIKTVGMGDHRTIKRGDGIEKEMTILFCSIKDFHKDSSLLQGSEVIDRLNQCYSIISPIITRYGGFVDKFIDETVMALFPDRPESCISAAIEINRYLKGLPFKMSCGIHSGKQFIGIVGDEKRVDATVISDVVNTASRINSFTRKINRDILVSEDTFNEILDKSKFKSTYMGRVKLKGKSKFIGIYAIYIDEINKGDKMFSHSMKELETRSLVEIEEVIRKIKLAHPDHEPSKYYLELIKQNRSLEDREK